jgi:hypothetical protein
MLALKHDSIHKDKYAIGKINLMLHYMTNPFNAVTSESSLDWESKKVEHRIAAQYQFSDDYIGKVKVNNEGLIEWALRYRLSSSASAIISSGISTNRRMSIDKAKS